MQKVFQVFVSSTYDDLQDERRMVSETLAKAGYIPVGMELFPATDERQLAYIKRVIDRSDYYVVIVGGRYGRLADDNLSFTEQEYLYAVEQGKPVLAFLHKYPDKIEVGKTDKDKRRAKKLEKFRNRLSTGRLINYWTQPEDLCTAVAIAVANQVNLTPGVGWVRGDEAIDPKIMQDIERVRVENDGLKRRLEQFEGNPEKPFIYGGFGSRQVILKAGVPGRDAEYDIVAYVTMANYGRSPGFITHIEVGKGLAHALPDEPVYEERFDISDFYPPDMKTGDSRPTRAYAQIPNDGRHAVFQRVWYSDVAGRLFFSGSVYRLWAEQSPSYANAWAIRDEPLRSGSAYWAWGAK
jgi:hypothetical protein